MVLLGTWSACSELPFFFIDVKYIKNYIILEFSDSYVKTLYVKVLTRLLIFSCDPLFCSRA